MHTYMHIYTQHTIPPTLQLLSVETSAVYEEEEQYRYSCSSACESTGVAHIQRKNYSIKEKGFKRISFELLERTAVLVPGRRLFQTRGVSTENDWVTKLEQRVQDLHREMGNDWNGGRVPSKKWKVRMAILNIILCLTGSQ